MSQERVRILWNREVAPNYFHMGLEVKKSCRNAAPGQFVMLRANHRIDPLLRRPFSIHQVVREGDAVTGLEILYKVVGRSTAVLSGIQAGESIDLLGALGKGFTVEKEDKGVFIAGGGIGIAPMLFLASSLVENGIDPSRCVVFIGGRTGDDILCRERFEELGMEVVVATDDGSRGEKGFVTDIMAARVGENRPERIYACGPHPMLEAVAEIACAADVACELSIETVMACGMGACLGCAVESSRDSEKYLHVCLDGPVFNAEDLGIRQ